MQRTLNRRKRQLHQAQSLVPLALAQNVAKLLQRASNELGVLPQVGCEEAVCVCDCLECGLERVLKGLGGARGSGVGV
jgi:hypothetical protein